MRLFDTAPRDNPEPAAHQEPHFPFLNRVSTPYWAEIRCLLEDWFDRIALDERTDLRARFRSSDDRQHVAAFWELYLHELFIRLGFTVRLHPEILGQTTTPDLAVARGDEAFYIEAVVLTDKELQHRSARRRGQVYDAINKRVKSPNFFLDVETVVEGTDTPPLRQIAAKLQTWLDSLDPDEAIPHSGLAAYHALPVLEQGYGTWRFRFRAVPKRSDRRTIQGPTVGMFGPPQAVWVNDHTALRERVEDKSRKYGDLDRPLVFALLYERWTAGSHHLAQALYGWGYGQADMMRSGRIEPTWPPEANGAWLTREGPVNRTGAAVLAAIHLAPHSIARTELHVWHHPWARRPLKYALPFAAMALDHSTGEIEAVDPSRRPSNIFGLAEDWPPGQPFPRSQANR